MYSTENIIWIKNVKRNKGEDWAYEDKTGDAPFLLNWPTSKKGSAATPKVGDIIVLFQRPNFINGKRNQHVHITHLVTPISETVLIDDDQPTHKWCREVKLIAKANPISAIPNPGYYNFFKPNRGLTNPIANLTNNQGMSEVETREDIWRLFNAHFCTNIAEEIFIAVDPQGIFGEIEGDKIILEHIKQELIRRNSKLVQQVKDKAFAEGNGRIKCECCDFDFLAYYGVIGHKFIECHHKIHLSTGERLTKPEDLALVCSNCHRMLHKRKSDGKYYEVDTLKQLILNNNN